MVSLWKDEFQRGFYGLRAIIFTFVIVNLNMKFVLCLVTLLSIQACSNKVPTRIKQNYALCYTGEKTTIDLFIRNDGFYTIARPIKRPVYNKGVLSNDVIYESDSVYQNILFFDDGTMVMDFWYSHGSYRTDNPNMMPVFFEKLLSDKDEATFFYSNWHWGLYKIIQDTIITQWVNHPPPFNHYWDAYETAYKIVDKETLVKIYSKPLDILEGANDYNKQNQAIEAYAAKFIASKVKPKSDPWLKNEIWFWCDELHYKAWREEQKVNKGK